MYSLSIANTFSLSTSVWLIVLRFPAEITDTKKSVGAWYIYGYNIAYIFPWCALLLRKMVVAGLILNTGRKKIGRRTRKWYSCPNVHRLFKGGFFLKVKFSRTDFNQIWIFPPKWHAIFHYDWRLSLPNLAKYEVWHITFGILWNLPFSSMFGVYFLAGNSNHERVWLLNKLTFTKKTKKNMNHKDCIIYMYLSNDFFHSDMLTYSAVCHVSSKLELRNCPIVWFTYD